jgi:pimeloyl-ACP methyl ester carboxylesterase
MTTPSYPIPVTEGHATANGLNMWYVEAGQGSPLLLLHGGTVSNGPLWADPDWGWEWGPHLGTFAQHFRVIAPDTRGHGRTRNSSGVQSYATYAEDVIALIQALQLEKPLLCGWSDGGITASLVGIMAPDLPRAIVNLAGFDLFNPDPELPTRRFVREWLGGASHATRADVAGHYDQMVRQDPDSPMRQRRIDDFEPTQGTGYLKRYYENCFEMWTTPMAYTLDDFRTITAPTLILVGDRDEFCSVEEGVQVYRTLPQGELGVIPGIKHAITPLVCTVTLDFLLRHAPERG